MFQVYLQKHQSICLAWSALTMSGRRSLAIGGACGAFGDLIATNRAGFGGANPFSSTPGPYS